MWTLTVGHIPWTQAPPPPLQGTVAFHEAPALCDLQVGLHFVHVFLKAGQQAVVLHQPSVIPQLHIKVLVRELPQNLDVNAAVAHHLRGERSKVKHLTTGITDVRFQLDYEQQA